MEAVTFWRGMLSCPSCCIHLPEELGVRLPTGRKSPWHLLHFRASSFTTLVKPEAHRGLMETVELTQWHSSIFESLLCSCMN